MKHRILAAALAAGIALAVAVSCLEKPATITVEKGMP